MCLPYNYTYGKMVWVMKMNLRQLYYFYDAAQGQNLAKTAQKYMVPPSAVSSAVKRLEEELGVNLFDRTSNKILLNEKGKLFAHEVGIALERVDNAVKQLRDENQPQKQIRILIQARPKWITELISEYKKYNHQVNFIVSNDYSATNFEDFDVVIGEDSGELRRWERFLLSIEVIYIKASADSPLVSRELRLEQIKEEDFVLPGQGNGMRKMYERLCKQHGFKPRVAIECNDRQCLQYYVGAGMGLTLGAARALNDSTQGNISPLRVMDFNETQSVYVFYKNSDNLCTAGTSCSLPVTIIFRSISI